MIEPKVGDVAGRYFATPKCFGEYSPVPVLLAMDEVLSPGVVARFVTPMGRPLRGFLRENGRLFLRSWRRQGELDHSGRGGKLTALAAFVEDQALTRLATWFRAFDANGDCLIEMENGNNYIWIAKKVESAATERLIESARGPVMRIKVEW